LFLAQQGKKLRDGYNSLVAEIGIPITNCRGFDCRSIVTFDPSTGQALELKSLMQQELFKRGILWSGFHNMSFSHTAEDISYTLEAYRDVLTVIGQALRDDDVRGYLRGQPVEPVFRRTSNFNMKPKLS
jgi:glutamate-1-semialdehyde aminotransferase